MGEVTRDALFDGSLTLWQPARGYRANVDALLLAAFARKLRTRKLLDLGAGVGTVTLALSRLGSVERATLIERDVHLAELARKNLQAAGVRADVVVADLRRGLAADWRASADLVVCNPPFFQPRSSRPAHDPSQRAARTGELEPFVVAAAAALGRRARACFVYPAASLPELLAAAAASHLVAKRLRFVHANADAPARVALVELLPARPGGLVVEAPLYEWLPDGCRSAEITALLAGPSADRR